MRPSGGFRPGDSAAMVLATVLTMLGGLFCCLFVAISSSRDPRQPVMIAVLSFAGAAWLISLLRGRPASEHRESLWSRLFHRPKTRKVTVKVKRNRTASLEAQPPAGPPTAERIRDLKEHASTWVPSGNVARRGPRDE
jgi:hypothetical protein